VPTATGAQGGEQDALSGFADPSGLVHDGQHLIVADSGHNRLQVFEQTGRLAATITHYEHARPAASASRPHRVGHDRDNTCTCWSRRRPKSADQPIIERTLPLIQQDYLLAAQDAAEDPTRLIKLKSWREPRLLGRFRCRCIKMSCRSPSTPGSRRRWYGSPTERGRAAAATGGRRSDGPGRMGRRDQTLRCPRQSGGQPILNIDPQTGHLYVEDDSDYRLKRHGTVYRIDQAGTC
jgi:hypothetical protein